ncbi:MAG: hypothetical protein RLY86_2310 [Pseudomonadota bacterium]
MAGVAGTAVEDRRPVRPLGMRGVAGAMAVDAVSQAGTVPGTGAGADAAAGAALGTGMELALLIHGALALLALWPALRLLARAGLPRVHAAWLLLPILGWPAFATVLAFRRWPTLPTKAEKLHPREALRRQRAAAAGREG